jgi:hypothetical protein
MRPSPSLSDRRNLRLLLLQFIVISLCISVPVISSACRTGHPPRGRLKHISSIAFYINIGHTHKVTPDLRGNFWEWQLPSPVLNISVTYVGDGPCRLINDSVCFQTPFNGMWEYVDDRQCLRTQSGWRHFVTHNSEKRWYFKGVHDTFVNISLLEELIEELEGKCDPMNEPMMAFNLHEYGRYLYPQGGSGWVFSNYVVRKLWENVDAFQQLCDGAHADDVAIGHFLPRLGWNVTDYQMSRFMPYWPLVKVNWDSVEACPPNYLLFPNAMPLRPTPCRRLIAVHMHEVPMDVAYQEYHEGPECIGFFAGAPFTSFCRL